MTNFSTLTLSALVLLASIAVTQAETDQQQTPLARSTAVMPSPFPDDYDEIEAGNWRTVKLTLDLSHGGHCDITLLRPLPWIIFTGASVGGSVDLQMPEMGIVGQAKVTAIEPCPESDQPRMPGTRPVIGKFVTTNAKVIELSVTGLDDPIGTTASHPFWSVDRNGWVAAGDLNQGETLRTIDGTATVAGLEPCPGTEAVYYLEVHKDHTFFVSDAKLWVHNTCLPGNSPKWKGFKPFRGKTKTNGLSGSKKRYYEWDHTHGEIEVYNKSGKHPGVMDPVTGHMIKPAVPGRSISI